MLEPTVRPGNASATNGSQQGKPAFENRTFDDLLDEAKTIQADASQAEKIEPVKADPLAALGGLGEVENAALREVLAKSRGTDTGLGKTETE